MSRRPCIFKQRDVTKAVKAVIRAGLQVCLVRIDPQGKIEVVTNKQEEQSSCEASGGNEWDRIS
jgi:hypothetical protein